MIADLRARIAGIAGGSPTAPAILACGSRPASYSDLLSQMDRTARWLRSKGIKRSLRTSEAGVFAAPSLIPAEGYVVTATKQGFVNYEVKGVQVQVGQNVDLAILLTVAGATTQVQVEATAPIVDSDRDCVSTKLAGGRSPPEFAGRLVDVHSGQGTTD